MRAVQALVWFCDAWVKPITMTDVPGRGIRKRRLLIQEVLALHLRELLGAQTRCEEHPQRERSNSICRQRYFLPPSLSV